MDKVIYIVCVGLIIMVLSSAYFLILSKYKTYNSNRVYLFFVPIVSFIVPLLSFGNSFPGGFFPVMMEQVTVSGTTILGKQAAPSFTIWNYLIVIWVAGMLIMALRLMFDLNKINHLIKNSIKVQIDGISVFINKKAKDTFTFINKIVAPGESPGPHVLQHELYHVLQLHFIDLFLAEIVSIVFWFIPGISAYKKAVVMNHEYSADQYSSSLLHVDEYCERLLSTAFKIDSFNACHTFNNYSLTKSRIKMMYKKTSGPLQVIINYLLIIPFVLFAVFIASAKSENLLDNKTPATSIANEEDVIMPSYPGGQEALYKFMGENVKFTDAAKKEGIEGTVFVGFVINASGKVESVKVVKGVSDELNSEAVRVVKMMPDWIPGTKDGKKVNMEMTLPIKFVLN